jgi:hypothetical protein
MATIIKQSGSMLPFPLKSGKAVLEDMQEAVGGYIQIIQLQNGQWLVMDEEAKFKPHEANLIATQMALPMLMEGDYIAGDVVLLEHNEID